MSSFFDDQCTLRVVSVRSPQSLSTIYISCSMTLKREISGIMNFRFPYANQFVKRCEKKNNRKPTRLAFTLFHKIMKLKDWNIRPGCFCWPRLIFFFLNYSQSCMRSSVQETNCENLCKASAYEFSTIEILPSLVMCFIIQYFMISAH